MKTTYGANSKIAEIISIEEFNELLAADDNPNVYPAPRSPRQIAIGARLVSRTVYFDRCTKTGHAVFEAIYLSKYLDRAPIFHFESTNRVVQVGSD